MSPSYSTAGYQKKPKETFFDFPAAGNIFKAVKQTHMKTLLFLLSAFVYTATFCQTSDAYFLTQPSLSPDGQTVMFSYEGDIWKADITDGRATRLTAMQGYESNAKISPDGKWIAFTGRQFGNADVFVMPLEGGEVKQLTYFSGTDEVSSWSWDSKTIYIYQQPPKPHVNL